MVYTNDNGEVISQVEAEHNTKCEELADHICNAYSTADWNITRKMFNRYILSVKLTVLMGVLIPLAMFLITRFLHTNHPPFITPADIIPIWMTAACFTCLCSIFGWVRMMTISAWDKARCGDIIGGVAVDILTVTFIGSYKRHTKGLFKRISFLSMIDNCLLVILYQTSFNAHGLYSIFAGGFITPIAIFTTCIIAAAIPLSAIIIINCWRILCADKYVTEQLQSNNCN